MNFNDLIRCVKKYSNHVLIYVSMYVLLMFWFYSLTALTNNIFITKTLCWIYKKGKFIYFEQNGYSMKILTFTCMMRLFNSTFTLSGNFACRTWISMGLELPVQEDNFYGIFYPIIQIIQTVINATNWSCCCW